MEGDGGGRGEPQCIGQGYDLYNIEKVHKVRILIHTPYIKVMPGYFLSLKLSYFLHKHQMKAKTHRHIQWAHMGVCNGQTDFALTLTIWPEKEIMAATLSYLL